MGRRIHVAVNYGDTVRPPTASASTRFSQDFGIIEMIGDGGGSAAGGPWRLFRIGTGYGEPHYRWWNQNTVCRSHQPSA